jgi:membrane-associated protease RseP (regulator of RpoE activity)
MSETRRYGDQNTVKDIFKVYIIPLLLFIVTLITTTIAGAYWVLSPSRGLEISQISAGLPYSLSIIAILGFHEFGHYFASRYHGVKATLPYFIPFPTIAGMLNFGTMGAVIKTQSPIYNRKALFDIGVAGPIAGFIISLFVLGYGFQHLPGKEFILNLHPDYDLPTYGQNGLSLAFGDNLLFIFFRELFAKSPDGFIPPMSEIYHYPYLCAGWFGLFVTALNLLPVGQLDGGHIFYSMFGEKIQEKVAWVAMFFLLIAGGLGIFNQFYATPLDFGWSGWFLWALLLYFVIKVKHPPLYDPEPIGWGRMVVGYIGIFIFIVSFIPIPFIIPSGVF